MSAPCNWVGELPKCLTVFWVPAEGGEVATTVSTWGINFGFPNRTQGKFSSLRGDLFGWSQSPLDKYPQLPGCSGECECLITLHQDFGKMQRLRGCLCSTGHGGFSPTNITPLALRGVHVNQLILIFMNKSWYSRRLKIQGKVSIKIQTRVIFVASPHPVLWQRSCLYLWHGAFIKDLKNILQTKPELWLLQNWPKDGLKHFCPCHHALCTLTITLKQSGLAPGCEM